MTAMGKGSRSVSFVGGLSLSQRVLYRRFHCLHTLITTENVRTHVPDLDLFLPFTVLAAAWEGGVVLGGLMGTTTAREGGGGLGEVHCRTLAMSSVPLSRKSETLLKPEFLIRGVRIPVASLPSCRSQYIRGILVSKLVSILVMVY